MLIGNLHLGATIPANPECLPSADTRPPIAVRRRIRFRRLAAPREARGPIPARAPPLATTQE